MHPSAVPAFCRVTVLAPGRHVDVALPADVTLAELVPMVLELLGAPLRAPDRPEPWRFTGAAGGLLPPGATLDELGVLDGEVLRLGSAAPPPPAPVFDDPVDALAALAPERLPDARWPAVAALALTLAAAGLLATARAGGSGDVPVEAAVGLGGVGAVVALGYAARAARRQEGAEPADDDDLAGAPGTELPAAGHQDGGAGDEDSSPGRLAALVAASCAVPLAAAAGWAALPDPPGATHLLLAAVAGGIAAAVGQVAARTVVPVLVTAVVVAVVTGTAAVVTLRFEVPVPALAAVVTAVALSAGPLLPRAVLRLAGLPRPVVPADARDLVAADAGPDLLAAAELAERARVARAQLAGLSGGCAVSAAVAAAVAASGGLSGQALAAVVVAVLLLRVRDFADPGPAGMHLAAGIAAGIALVGLGAAAGGPIGRPAGALVLLGAAALGVQALGGQAPWLPAPVLSPVVRRAVDLAEGILTAVAVPLALAAAGVFELVRGL